MDEEYIRILDYIKGLGAGKDRVEFDLDKAASDLSISRETLERAIFSLQKEGYLKIVKMPATDIVLEEIRSNLKILNALLIAGELTRNSYLKKWDEMTKIIDEPSFEQKPLPPLGLGDMIRSLKDVCGFIEKLEKQKGQISAQTYEKLAGEYRKEFIQVLDLLKDYVEAGKEALSIVGKELESLHRKLELIDIDSRIRGLDRKEERDSCLREMRKSLDKLYNITKKFISPVTQIAASQNSIERKIRELESLLKEKVKEFEVIRAKILIEGKEELKKEKALLGSEIKRIRKELSELTKKLEISPKEEDIMKEVTAVSRKINESKILSKRDVSYFEKVRDILKNIYEISKFVDQAIPFPEGIPRIVEVLKGIQ